jgi:two-component system CitB family sensor kinase
MPRLTFARQMYVLVASVVLVVVAIAAVTFGVLSTLENRANAESTALAIARTVAATPAIRAEVERLSGSDDVGDPESLAAGPVQAAARDAIERTDALFVVITDDRGVRLAHPNDDELGRVVSTDPSEALAGRETTEWESGTLGESARAKVPVFGLDGRTVVGEVSVGFGAERVLGSVRADLVAIGLVAVLALAVGFAASALLVRRLRRQTLGLQPAELAGLVQDQTAVLGGIGEGVLGVARDGRVTVCNGRAAELLGLSDAVGEPVASLGIPAEVLEAIDAVALGASRSLRVVALGRILYADVARVSRDGIDLGAVVALRDETDLESLTHRLSAVSAMSTGLRVQRHEYANRLHLLSGLLATDRVDDAREYLGELIGRGTVAYPLPGAELLREPYLQAFLGAKALEAQERGVTLRIGEETLVLGSVERAEEVTAVLGNLVDNAVDAAVLGGREPRWVEVEALDDGADLHLAVADSGDGVAAGSDPWQSRAPRAVEDPARVRGLGFGLPLARELARRRGGDLWLADAGSPASHGAVFCARLADVMTPDRNGPRDA